jgi:hypothetical protein
MDDRKKVPEPTHQMVAIGDGLPRSWGGVGLLLRSSNPSLCSRSSGVGFFSLDTERNSERKCWPKGSILAYQQPCRMERLSPWIKRAKCIVTGY